MLHIDNCCRHYPDLGIRRAKVLVLNRLKRKVVYTKINEVKNEVPYTCWGLFNVTAAPAGTREFLADNGRKGADFLHNA
jgi:hypothetical protein